MIHFLSQRPFPIYALAWLFIHFGPLRRVSLAASFFLYRKYCRDTSIAYHCQDDLWEDRRSAGVVVAIG